MHNKRHLASILLSLFGLMIIVGLAIGLSIDHARQTRGIFYGFPDPTNSPPALLDRGLSVNVNLEQYDEKQLIENLNEINNSGEFTWIRQTFPWSQIEPAQNQFNWTKWDKIVDAAKDFHIIAVLDTTPSWANSTSNFQPPTSNLDFANFARAFAQRYGDRIDYYQIWDEPNLGARWNNDVNPVAYAEMLRQARDAIKSVDPTSAIILAGLAPTIEQSNANMADWLYLRRLYEAGAGSLFDVASGKPYGFSSAPYDHSIDPNVLNFQHIVLMHEEMVAHGDAGKAIWASNFGWNTADNSLWGKVSDQQQKDYTEFAIVYARFSWPWLGVMSIENWEPNTAKDDPHWGFAVKGKFHIALGSIIGPQYIPAAIQLRPGDPNYQPNPHLEFTGDWRFSELGADWSATGDSVRAFFRGTDVAIRVRRAADRANLYIKVDGQPANALPQDDRGAYLQLIPPDALTTDISTIPVAKDMGWESVHEIDITAERGWNQWALIGISGGQLEDMHPLITNYLLLAIIGLALTYSTIRNVRKVQWRSISTIISTAYSKLSNGKQIAVTLLTSLFLYASAWMTWGVDVSITYRRTGDVANIIATLAAATIFYVSPWLILTIISGLVLLILIILRLDLGLALVALFAPFFFLPKELFYSAFSMAELILVMCVVAYVVRSAYSVRRNAKDGTHTTQPIMHYALRITSLDWSIIALLLVSIIATLLADYKVFALRELRVIILEPIIYYALIRSSKLDRSALWRIVDALILAGTLVAIIGLIQYAFHINIITAEEGTERLRSVYGSPNNVGLFLGRVFPIGLALTLLGNEKRRRILYGLALIPIAAAIILSQSRGALFLGIPASILAIGILAGGKWLWRSIGALAVAGLASIPLLNSPRIQALFNGEGGTSFFRVSLWKSTLDMIRDHPLFGVGPDNFLYAYRDRYLRPEAWQESALSHPHNFMLDFAARLGLVGLGAFIWIQVSFWRIAYRLARIAKEPMTRALAIGLSASMIDFLAHGLVDASYFVVDLAFVFMLTLALMQRLRQEEEKKRRQEDL